jgi:hypothetical protein
MQKTYDMVVVTGKYTNRNGEEKKSYLKIGSVFTKDDGKMSCKIDAIPTGAWDGWVGLYTPEVRDGQSKSAQPFANQDTPF